MMCRHKFSMRPGPLVAAQGDFKQTCRAVNLDSSNCVKRAYPCLPLVQTYYHNLPVILRPGAVQIDICLFLVVTPCKHSSSYIQRIVTNMGHILLNPAVKGNLWPLPLCCCHSEHKRMHQSMQGVHALVSTLCACIKRITNVYA